jgi:hypothetical protein
MQIPWRRRGARIEPNPELLGLWHWQSDALTTQLDLIRNYNLASHLLESDTYLSYMALFAEKLFLIRYNFGILSCSSYKFTFFLLRLF